MSKIVKLLEGKKTYLAVVAAFVVGGLNAVGVLDTAMTEKIWTILTFLGLGFLRLGIKNIK